MRDILINNKNHLGRGDCAIIFKVDSVQEANIFLSSKLEYIHKGDIHLKEIFYAGTNPYSIFSNLSYNVRYEITSNKIDIRGCGK